MSMLTHPCNGDGVGDVFDGLFVLSKGLGEEVSEKLHGGSR